MTTSSPFESPLSAPSKVAHVVIGPGHDQAMDALAAQSSDVVHLQGTKSEGRSLLELIANYDQIIYWPWTAEVGA